MFLEKDGYFYGRGTQDMKDGIAIMMTTLLRYRAEGYRPDRDIILALTADEEGGTANGVDWLLKNRRDLVDAEFVLNHDGGGVMLDNGKVVQVDLTASEKVYADFDLTVTNPGGHSSVPPRENAIYSLARALDRVSSYDFAFELNNVTRAYFERVAQEMRTPRTPASARSSADAAGSAGAEADLARTDLQRDRAHDVCRDALVRRPREQRFAADGACERELPHPARPFAGGSAAGAGAGSSPIRRSRCATTTS